MPYRSCRPRSYSVIASLLRSTRAAPRLKPSKTVLQIAELAPLSMIGAIAMKGHRRQQRATGCWAPCSGSGRHCREARHHRILSQVIQGELLVGADIALVRGIFRRYLRSWLSGKPTKWASLCDRPTTRGARSVRSFGSCCIRAGTHFVHTQSGEAFHGSTLSCAIDSSRLLTYYPYVGKLHTSLCHML